MPLTAKQQKNVEILIDQHFDGVRRDLQNGRGATGWPKVESTPELQQLAETHAKVLELQDRQALDALKIYNDALTSLGFDTQPVPYALSSPTPQTTERRAEHLHPGRRRQFGERVGDRCSRRRGELLKELLHPDGGGREQRQEPAGAVAAVLPRVGHVLRDEEERSRRRVVDVVLQAHPERAFEEVDRLVRVVVGVEGRAFSRRCLGLERAQRSARLLAERLDLDRSADRVAQRLALPRADDEARCGAVGHGRTVRRHIP